MDFVYKALLILSFSSISSVLCNGNGTLISSIAKESKQFSLFSIVTFKNVECNAVSTSGLKGVCMTSTECASKGTGDGNCAASFGVCCVIRVSTCGGVASSNCTYIDNPGYPSSYKTTGDCSYTITRVQTDICQIRLDFFSAVLQQPVATTGLCTSTILTTTQGSTGVTFYNTPPLLCGTLTGQHVYVEAGTANTAATLKFTLASALDNTWRIKVSQIECWNPSRAPNGCLQYFTGARSTVKSFNWDGTHACTTGCFLQHQQYPVCFRPEKGMCSMAFSTTSVASTLDAFFITASAKNAGTGSYCSTAHLKIYNGVASTNDAFCHTTLNIVQSISAGIAGTALGQVVYAESSNPWTIEIGNDGAQNSLAGVSVDAAQLPCTGFSLPT
jgi:hypothetical protein